MTASKPLLTSARAAFVLLATAGPGVALDIADCTRVIHVSHGGEAGHMDMGNGWTAWTEWWSQEGVYSDLKVTQCAEGRQLTARLREERIRDRAFDRRRAGQDAFERYMGRAPAFWRMEDLQMTLNDAGGDTRIDDIREETCACAALYPEARGELTPFALN